MGHVVERLAEQPPLWRADALRAATGGTMREAFDATGVSIDTRTLRPGDLFVALVGENGDGHAHVADALAKGAAGALVHQAVPGANRLLQVDDTLRGLHALGAAGRARFGGRVVAVTGSVGKTTTKEMLRRALSPFGTVHAAEASYNNHWGVPLTLARLPADADFCVAEIGTNHPGEIAPLARLVRPHVAVVTTVAAVHIGFFGTVDAIAAEKGSIAAGLEPGGTMILPAGHSFLPRLRQAAGHNHVVLFGRADDGADAMLRSATGDASGFAVEAGLGGTVLRFNLAAPGAHMADNAVAALAAVSALGLDTSQAAAALDGFSAVTGRGAQRQLDGITLLDESYNASGPSVRAALGVLRLLGGRKVAVLGDMRELGEHGETEHAALAADVAGNADVLFACGPLMRHLFDAVPPALRGEHTADSASLAPVVAAALQPGDSVLVKGSLGSRMRLVVQAIEARG